MPRLPRIGGDLRPDRQRGAKWVEIASRPLTRGPRHGHTPMLLDETSGRGGTRTPDPLLVREVL